MDVASGQPGKTNKIIEETFAIVDALKPTFTTSDPEVVVSI